jgi:hypothetical protein
VAALVGVDVGASWVGAAVGAPFGAVGLSVAGSGLRR